MLKIEQVIYLFLKNFHHTFSLHIVKGRGTVPSLPKSSSLQSDPHETIDELEMRLLLKTEENDALKNALKSMLDAKEEDLKLYNETIQSVKDIFLQGIQHYKPLQTT
jgi:hypothetical protein